MQEIDVAALSRQVLWAAFALAVLFGALAQRTHFCTMGAVADIVATGDWSRMRMWVLAMGTAIIGFNALVAFGGLRAADSIYAGPRLLWWSAIAGGAMFGFGMVLASGCGSKTLVRIGGGNLKSLVVFVVLGVAAFATLRGITGVVRVAAFDAVALDLGRGQDLPTLVAAWTGQPRERLALWLGALVGGALAAWALIGWWRDPQRRRDLPLGGLGIGALVVALWWVSGHLGHLAEHPQTLEEVFLATNSQRMESFSFVAPAAYTLDWLMFFSDRTKLLTIGIVASSGVVVGSAVQALAARSFRWEGFRNAEDTASHLIGAVLMGIGGVTAMGCTIGQGVSGLSTLSLTSALALASMLAGALAALRLQVWRMERAA